MAILSIHRKQWINFWLQDWKISLFETTARNGQVVKKSVKENKSSLTRYSKCFVWVWLSCNTSEKNKLIVSKWSSQYSVILKMPAQGTMIWYCHVFFTELNLKETRLISLFLFFLTSFSSPEVSLRHSVLSTLFRGEIQDWTASGNRLDQWIHTTINVYSTILFKRAMG